MQDFRGKRSIQQDLQSLHLQIGLKFKDETSRMQHFELRFYDAKFLTLWKNRYEILVYY